MAELSANLVLRAKMLIDGLGGALWPAQSMGWPDVGALAAGKLADVIAVQGDPLTDIKVMDTVALVVREGVVVKNVPNLKS